MILGDIFIFLQIMDEVTCYKYDDNTHYLLESDEFTLGALSVTYPSILHDLILSHSNRSLDLHSRGNI